MKINKFMCTFSLLAAVLLPTIAQAQCYISGCNGQICSSSQEPTFGKCEWVASDQCYTQYGICEEDANGNCNWRDTEELQECLTRLQQQLPPGLVEVP